MRYIRAVSTNQLLAQIDGERQSLVVLDGQ